MAKTESTTYEQMGMAALLPGMQHLVSLMQAELDRMRSQLAAKMQNGAVPKRRGRPAKSGSDPRVSEIKNYWAKMTPEERSAEMRRRMGVAAAKATPTKLHPRDPRHPEHAEWRAKMSKVQKHHWANLTAAEKKRRQNQMKAGKKAKAA